MKKFSLIMVFVLLMTLIVSFNYLLWDRESKMKELANLESINAGKNVSINAQNSEIQKLEHDKAELQKKVEDIQKESNELRTEIKNLSDEIYDLKGELQNRNTLIFTLIEKEDLSRLTNPVAQWINAINEGEYEKAWNIEFGAKLPKDRSMDLETYTNAMKEGIDGIKLISAQLNKEAGKDNGLIFLSVKLEVALSKRVKAPYCGYNEGENVKLVRIDYSPEQEEYFIADIDDAP